MPPSAHARLVTAAVLRGRTSYSAEWLRRADAGLIPRHAGPGITLVEMAAAAGSTEGEASGALSD